MEYTRTTHDTSQVNQYVRLASVRTVITFRTQQLLDLWENEMVGQISDGMWENSPNTEWLWRNVYIRLGDKTEVVNNETYHRKRTSFPLTKELWDIVGDRIMVESGFNSKAEATSAWKEIADAIRNWQNDDQLIHAVQEMGELMERDTRTRMQVELDGVADWMAESGIEVSSRSNGWLSATFDRRYWSINRRVNGKEGFWQFAHPISFRVPEGKLQAGLEKARTFVTGIQEELGGYV